MIPNRIRKTWVLFNVALLLVLIGGVLPGALEAVFIDREAEVDVGIPNHAEAQYRYIRNHLEGSFYGYSSHQTLVPEFDIIALSHMASGMMNLASVSPARREELAPLTLQILERALTMAPYERDPREATALGQHNLYHSHLNLILGVHRHVSGSKDYDDLHLRISKHLRARSLADGDFHARSYADYAPGKWPADQSVTLASLHVYDRIHGTSLGAEPIRGWLGEMARRTDPALGLHHSALSDSLWYAKIPRGCALSWTILYMAQFAPEEAARLYARYQENYATSVLGFGGFREWPPGTSHRSDVDSGPIIFGLGMAATGLGIGPARIFGDGSTYAASMRSATVFGVPSRGLVSGRRYRLAPLIGEAMLFNGTTARVWFGEAPARVSQTPKAPAPVGAIIIVVLLVLVTLLPSWALYREFRPSPDRLY
ncbi:MAG: hypothetical protein ACNA8W_15435 [Bradymonadaceae bacterium]